MNIWLFDLDGVLVQPLGYREALRRTVADFALRMGFPGRRLLEVEIEAFEAQGITCEWDMVAISAAELAAAVWEANPDLVLPEDFSQALESLAGAPSRPSEPDLAEAARRLGDTRAFADTPSDAALSAWRRRYAANSESDSRWSGRLAFLSTLLGRPRDFYSSPVIRRFQTYTVGSETYRAFYECEPEIETPSLLETLDRPALTDGERRRLLDEHASGRIRCAVITARPNSPQIEGYDEKSYAPEAELAMRAIGLEAIPVVGAGHTLWLAREHRRLPDAYLKPRAAHALAGISSALGAEDRSALEAAYALAEDGRLLEPLSSLRGSTVKLVIFEDTSSGVRGTIAAGDAMRQADISVELQIIGIASGSEKTSALEALGARVFERTGPALESALSSLI